MKPMRTGIDNNISLFHTETISAKNSQTMIGIISNAINVTNPARIFDTHIFSRI